MTAEYIRQLETSVLAGLLNRDDGTPASVRAQFHKNVHPDIFISTDCAAVCQMAKDLYNRTGDCDPVVLLSEISTKQPQFGRVDVMDGTNIVFAATRANRPDFVALTSHLPILQQAAFAKCLPVAQKEVEKAVSTGMDYTEAYKKHITPIVERFKNKNLEQFNIEAEVSVAKEKIEGFKKSVLKNERTVPTGFCNIDAAMRGGMRPSQLIIIGARPATGKTTMALNIAASVADAGKHVVFVSLEQTADQLVEKIISLKAHCAFPKTNSELNSAKMKGHIAKLDEAANSFDFKKIHVVEKTDNIDTLCVSVNELCNQHDVGVVIIDYLQLIPSQSDRSRYEGITKISNKLKMLAKDADVPIVCLAQLSRGSDTEKRDPRLADLRDSGSIEQDADIGILLYNDMTENKEEGVISYKRRVYFDIQKNRNGSIRKIAMDFIPTESTFVETNNNQYN